VHVRPNINRSVDFPAVAGPERLRMTAFFVVVAAHPSRVRPSADDCLHSDHHAWSPWDFEPGASRSCPVYVLRLGASKRCRASSDRLPSEPPPWWGRDRQEFESFLGHLAGLPATDDR